MRIQFDSDVVARAAAKRLVEMVDQGQDLEVIGPLKLGQAQRVTAAVLGYASWAELRKCLGTEPPSTLDEDLRDDELNARRAAQAATLHQVCSVPMEFAEGFLTLWCPSMSPSAYNNRSNGEDEDDEEDDVFSGPDGFRLAHPSDVNFGVDLCRGLNWPILSAGDDPEFGMSSVMVVGTNRNKPVPIFVSALAYIPGDEDDAQARQQRLAVAQFIDGLPGAPGACIVYQWPMMSDGYVFAGAVYRNGKWLDMAWSHALTSIDTLFDWADRGWDIHARKPQTADNNGTMGALVRKCMENCDMRKMGLL